MHDCPLALVLKKKEDDAKQTVEIHDYARRLWEAHGLKAIAEPLKRPEVSKSEAKANGPAIGDALKRSCLRCADRIEVEARERQRNSSSAASWMIAEPTAVSR